VTPESDPSSSQPPPADRTFTQAELDRIVADRLNRQKSQFADYEALKTKATKYDELEAQNKSELQKEREAREAAEKQRDEALTTAQRRVVRSEVVARAAGKLADPSDAPALLDLDEFKLDDKGEVDSKAIDAALDDLLKRKPHLAADTKRRTGSWDGGARPGGTTKPSMNDLIRSAARR
jgi:hypothetical protein